MPPRASARCLPLGQMGRGDRALRRSLRGDLRRDRVVARVVPVRAPLVHVEADVDEAVPVCWRGAHLPRRVLLKASAFAVERLVTPGVPRTVHTPERRLLPLRLGGQPKPSAMT